jgi:hypothetical protein
MINLWEQKMRKYKKLSEKVNKQFEKIINRSEEVNKNMKEFIEVNNRMLDNFENLDKVLEDIDREFAEKTGILNKKDQIFLWTAVALQISRIYIVSEITKIENAGKGELEEYLKKFQEEMFKKFQNTNDGINQEYRASLKQILTNKVPYDAIDGGRKFGIFKGANHRFATLGHDPILGYIFGTANILTNTITTVQLPLVSSYHVQYNEIYGNPQITKLASTGLMFLKVEERIKEDKITVALALIKQIIHIGTDLYTPKGIQIPGANLVLSKKNAEKLTKYINTGDIIKITFSAAIAMVINFIISVLHNLFYNENDDISRELYNVRTRKILKISNIIAESLDIIYVGANIIIGIYTENPILKEEGMKRIDLGGYIVAVHQILKSSSVQEKIRREYLENRLHDKFLGEEYSFLEGE